jgi:hypothetical protein
MIGDSVSQALGSRGRPDLVLFFAQVVIIFIVICTSLVNLTFGFGNQNLWTVILTGSLGYLMPNPKIKFSEDELLKKVESVKKQNVKL